MADAPHNNNLDIASIVTFAAGVLGALGIAPFIKESLPKMLEWGLKKSETEEQKKDRQSRTVEEILNTSINDLKKRTDDQKSEFDARMLEVQTQLNECHKREERMREREEENRSRWDQEREEVNKKILNMSVMMTETAKELEFIKDRQNKAESNQHASQSLDIATTAVAAAQILRENSDVLPTPDQAQK